MTNLFPDSFLAGISRLSLRVRPAPPRSLAGVHLSRAVGASLEFRDYQPYTAGDDLRRVDWNVYARTRHLYVRRFDRPTAIPVFVLVDASRSMFLQAIPGSPTRYSTAARAAAAVIMAAIASQNPVYLMVTDNHSPPASPMLTGRSGFVRALAELAMDREGGNFGISRAITALRPLLAARGAGILVVASDFFDDDGVNALLDSLRSTPGRQLLLQVTQPEDENPALTDDLEWVDCESGAHLDVSNGSVLDQYRAAYSNYFAALKDDVAARGSTLVTFDAASETLGQLQRIFPGGTLTL